MKKFSTLFSILVLTLFVFSFANCRTGYGAKKTKARRDIEYQQKKIDEQREKDGIN